MIAELETKIDRTNTTVNRITSQEAELSSKQVEQLDAYNKDLQKWSLAILNETDKLSGFESALTTA